MKSKIIFVLRIIIGALFIFSSISKMIGFEEIISTIDKFDIASSSYSHAIAVMVVFSEYALGTLLLLGIHIKKNALLLMLFTTGFIVIVTVNMVRGNITECGCFGTFTKREIGPWLIIQDFIILIVLFVIYKYNDHLLSLNNFKTLLINKDNKINIMLIFLVLSNILFYYTSYAIENKNQPNAYEKPKNDLYNKMPNYGNKLPQLYIVDIYGRIVSNQEIKDKIALFLFVPAPLSIDEIKEGYKKVLKPYKLDSNEVISIIYKNIHDKIIFANIKDNIGEMKKNNVYVFIDNEKEISKKFQLPECNCLIAFLVDKKSIVRLGAISPTSDIINLVHSRIVSGEYEK